MIGLLCLLGVAGALWFLSRLSTPTADRAGHSASQEPLNEFDVKVEGEITGASPAELRAARITLYLPQMPLQLSRRWEQLEHPTSNAFVLPLQLKAPCPASLCLLRVQLAGKELEAGRQQVEAGADFVRFPPYHVRR